jgi:hypothetical protein
VVVITLYIVMLITVGAMLAALGYAASGARRLDVHLCSLLHDQREHRHEMERNVERLRQYYNRT